MGVFSEMDMERQYGDPFPEEEDAELSAFADDSESFNGPQIDNPEDPGQAEPQNAGPQGTDAPSAGPAESKAKAEGADDDAERKAHEETEVKRKAREYKEVKHCLTSLHRLNEYRVGGV